VGQGSSAQSILYVAIVAGLSESIVEWIISRKADVNWAQEVGTPVVQRTSALHPTTRVLGFERHRASPCGS
jgi:hypothetical protein